MRQKPALAVTLIITTLFTSAPLPPAHAAARTDATANVQTSEGTDANERGLRFRLSEGAEESAPRPTPNAVAPAEQLSAAETERLLARLPPLAPADAQDFKLRERSLPPPRAGETLRAAFAAPAPAATRAPAAGDAPLEVTRVAPEGAVELAPAVSVTFSQPMVAVTSQAEAAAAVPVTLTPQPAGRWRWLGTQTLVFQPDAQTGRLPMATEYTVNVPAGTRDALGHTLAAARTFRFATPPPTLRESYPAGEGRPRAALIFLGFDQRVEPARVLEHLQLRPAARLRLATDAESAADEAVSQLLKRTPAGHGFVVRAVNADGTTANALPPDASVTVTVAPGTPSAEGPRVTAFPQEFKFETYGALRVMQWGCGYQPRCSSFDALHLNFNNQLDADNFNHAQVTITPAIPDAKIGVSYNMILIEGQKRANTTYTVTLAPTIRDVYGQTLTGETRFTFNVATAPPAVFSAGQGLVVLDPAVRHAYTVYSLNYRRLKVALYKVTPADWPRFRAYEMRRHRRDNTPQTPPGRLVYARTVEVQAAPDEITQTLVDLSPALSNGYGQAFVQVEGVDEPNAPVRVYAYRPDNRVDAWVQATGIALDAFADNNALVAWANELATGRPLAGVQLSVSPEGLNGTTDAQGTARLAFKDANASKGDALLVARRGDDVALLPKEFTPYYYDEDRATGWRRADATTTLAWYVFDDRKLYRPGEEVRVKGWIRRVNLTPGGDTELFAAAGQSAAYVLKDNQGNEVARGDAKLNALAGFDLALRLPAPMHLGRAHLEFKLGGDSGTHTHTFQVEEFRRPEFELTARTSQAPHFVGASATATAVASYYTGGGLTDTEVNWTVTAVPTNYTPPNRGDYTFGRFVPWWRSDASANEQTEHTFKGRTDAAGRHTLRLDFDGVTPPRPSSVIAEASVQDVNRQTLAATATMLVHPADVYVGLKSARTFVQQGAPFELSVIVTDLDGRALAGRDVALTLVRLDYVFEKGSWRQTEADTQEQTIKSANEAVAVRLPTRGGGVYRLTARVRDERARPNETELTLWVAGGRRPPLRDLAQEKVELIPDRQTYAGGDTAEILVQSPFAPAEGVMTLRRSGLLRTERFTMRESSYTLRVPLDAALTPNVLVQVDLVGATTRVDDAGNARPKLPPRPAYASGEINLSVPPDARRLAVQARPRAEVLEPGQETLVDVEVRDAKGRAVAGTDTAVVVVDEAVLALTDYKLTDPLSAFYAQREESTDDYHSREHVKLADTAVLERPVAYGKFPAPKATPPPASVNAARATVYARSASRSRDGEDMDTLNTNVAELIEDRPGVNLRRNFDALAVFAASVSTDAAGRAQVRVKLPDNLTRYRVMAVSVAGGRLAGTGESALTARLPLMARPSAPRFLNFGDRAELPVVVQNQTDQALTAAVAVRAVNAELTAGAGRRVNVPAHDRVEVRFPVAAGKPGTASFQIVAAAADKSDAAEVALPVYTPATTEAFATYGVLDAGAVAQPVRAPADAVPSFGGLEVSTASTQLQELTDAVIYLYHYPFECSEQLASRVISVAALKDVLAAFKTKDLPAPAEMRAAVAADLARLSALQNDDGGFDFWRRGARSVPYVSVHVAHALTRARRKDFAVDEETLKRAHNYLRQIERRIPADYSPEARRAIIAYALYVRALMDDRDPARARGLIAEAGGVEKLSLEALGWLLPVMSGDAASAQQLAAVRRHLNNRVTETAGAAHFADGYSDGQYTVLYSDRRADGVLLDALIGDQPQSDLIPKLVRGLLGGRTRGRWSNTQENVFILLALDRYFQTYEAATPDFVARVWLGADFAGERAFRGRTIERQQLELPMPLLAARTSSAPANLTIAKEGAGRLYFRVATTYAPASLKLAAADYGFEVKRTYEAVDDQGDVRRDAAGTWHVKAGARVRVHLEMFNPARRYHVALVDALPAGLEALNPALATTERVPGEDEETGVARGGRGVLTHYWFWRGPWYEHQNLRDERAEAFASLLWEGAHEYSYYARATTPGAFVVPPAKAEEMYAPETFGRTGSDRVIVE
ncbi:MAG TPA: alpha-2-macroglobulin family protein [Pyrinomonadaceae bacterium]|jgi:hypothetical protein